MRINGGLQLSCFIHGRLSLPYLVLHYLKVFCEDNLFLGDYTFFFLGFGWIILISFNFSRFGGRRTDLVYISSKLSIIHWLLG